MKTCFVKQMEEDNHNLDEEDRPSTRKKKKDELELFQERIKEGKCKLEIELVKFMACCLFLDTCKIVENFTLL